MTKQQKPLLIESEAAKCILIIAKQSVLIFHSKIYRISCGHYSKE